MQQKYSAIAELNRTAGQQMIVFMSTNFTTNPNFRDGGIAMVLKDNWLFAERNPLISKKFYLGLDFYSVGSRPK